MRHICHISTTFHGRSGSARRTSKILSACVRRGFRVSLIVGAAHDSIQIPGVDGESIQSLVKPIRPWKDVATAVRLRRRLEELRPDLVHTHLAKAGILGRWVASRVGVSRIVHTVHGPTFPHHLPAVTRRSFQALEKSAAARTDALIFVGEELRSSYLAAGVGTRERSRVIRTGRPDHQRTFEAGPARDPAVRTALCGGASCDLMLVQVGRLVPSKRPEHAVAAVEGLRRSGLDVHLVWVGEALVDSERAYGRRLRRRLRDLSYVHFTGFREDVLEIMRCADAVLLTSSHEGLPNVAVEAGLAGTPVVGYPVSGLAEVIEHGRTGWIVEGSEPRLLVAAILEMQEKWYEMEPRLEARRHSIARDYDEKRMTTQTLALYDELLSAAPELS